MMSFKELLWYENREYLVFYRFSKDTEWLQWHPENGYNESAMYKVVDSNTFEKII